MKFQLRTRALACLVVVLLAGCSDQPAAIPQSQPGAPTFNGIGWVGGGGRSGADTTTTAPASTTAASDTAITPEVSATFREPIAQD